jgi:hypothetical protein
MRFAAEHFALVIAVLVMVVAVAALPGWVRLVLVVPAALGGLWALLRLRQQSNAG